LSGTRDGHKAIDGIAKDAPTPTNIAYSDLNDGAPVTLTFTVPKIGKIKRIAVYDDGVGASATNFNVVIYDRDPNLAVDPGVIGENDKYSIDISGLSGLAAWILDRSLEAYYENHDDTQVGKLYIVLTTTGSTVDYAGTVQLDVVECGN
jgi:hypothetical protein